MSIDYKQREIRQETVVQADPVVVWETLTTSTGVAKWFGATADVQMRPGGRYKWSIPPAGRHQVDMEVTAVEPGRRFVLQSNPEPGGTGTTGVAESQVEVFTWTITPAGEGQTRITLVHSGFGDSFELVGDGAHWAWTTIFRRLRWVLEEGYTHQEHPWFGFTGGLLGMFLQVMEVLPDSPAAAAGLQAGDNIQRVSGLVLQGIDWPAEVFRHLQPGAPAEFVVMRNWQPVLLTMTPTARPLGLGEGESL